jgi:D-alanyl-D-alanine dipeptidase
MSGVNLLNAGPSKKKRGARADRNRLAAIHFFRALLLSLVFSTCIFSQSASSILPGPKPPDAPLEWKKFVGIYAQEKESVIILERDAKLWWHIDDESEFVLTPREHAKFEFYFGKPENGEILRPQRNAQGFVTRLNTGSRPFPRSDPGADSSRAYNIVPQRPVGELRAKALAAVPPAEQRRFRAPELVELAPLDPAIHLDIRYATAKDFLGVPVYTQARAFLQRPAAEALVRVLHKLQPFGYGLLIHDGYRPWYVTKIFWDATPEEGKIFVADPAQGSRHNRGCAVDLTLYDLKTGQPIEMTGAYDEMSPRSFPNYPGGTSLQRWHRDLLRRAMESEGFTVYDAEWWHFDYKDWHEYGILNIPFEKLGIGSPQK